jgi:hypothetical protein
MTIDDALALITRCRDVIDSTSAQNEALLYAGRRAGVKMEEIAGNYPPASGKPLTEFYERVDSKGRAYRSKFKSLRQQRKVIMLGKKGMIPTRRTGRLGASMTSDAQIVSPGIVMRVGTNEPSAKYVIGDPDTQNHYFNGVWNSLPTTIRQHSEEILHEFITALGAYLRGYIKRR